MLAKSVSPGRRSANHDGHTAFSSTQSGPYYDIFSLPREGEAGRSRLGNGGLLTPSTTPTSIFICLDSYESRSIGGQRDDERGCGRNVAASRQDWVIAFWHHPP